MRPAAVARGARRGAMVTAGPRWGPPLLVVLWLAWGELGVGGGRAGGGGGGGRGPGGGRGWGGGGGWGGGEGGGGGGGGGVGGGGVGGEADDRAVDVDAGRAVGGGLAGGRVDPGEQVGPLRGE